MKVKIFLLILVCSFLGILINEQNTLIRVPKEERNLTKASIETITGKITHISDGDSFTLNNDTEIRLFGIDAPELNQICFLTSENEKEKDNSTEQNNKDTLFVDIIKKDNTGTIASAEEVKCGENSKLKLAELTKNRTIFCSVKGKDVYDRLVSECYFEIQNKRTKNNNRININKEMVLSGNAVAFLQFSDKYVDDENKAKQENRGIWATIFDMPSVYRKKNQK
ncbi:MAG TPA: thermonuclease family protein [Rickettsiales bacterium]|nr:thermonuclease family protein [Rickettsiales bacterium]